MQTPSGTFCIVTIRARRATGCLHVSCMSSLHVFVAVSEPASISATYHCSLESSGHGCLSNTFGLEAASGPAGPTYAARSCGVGHREHASLRCEFQ
jgi:hypothetical protein